MRKGCPGKTWEEEKSRPYPELNFKEGFSIFSLPYFCTEFQ